MTVEVLKVGLKVEFGVIIRVVRDELPPVAVVVAVMFNNVILSVTGFDDVLETSKMYTQYYHGYTYKVDMTISLRLPKYVLNYANSSLCRVSTNYM